MSNVSGSLTAIGTGTAFTAKPFDHTNLSTSFNFSLSGTFVGTVQLQRLFPGNATWMPITALGNAVNFTGPCSEVFEEPEAGVQYRVNVTSYTSGTINYRFSR